MKTRIVIYALFSLLLFSFKPNGKCNQPRTTDKVGNDKAFHTIEVTMPVKGFINSCRTERVEDGQVLTLSPAPLMAEGNYLLLTDAEANLTDAQGKEFYFVGYYYGNEMIREKYTIVNDHGHVVMIKGDAKIKIKPGC